jgi:hypothetical protein
VWVLHNKRILDFTGSFGEWEEVSEARTHAAAVNAAEEVSLRRMHEKQKIRRTQNQKEGTKRSRRDAQTRIINAEQVVTALESKIATVSEALSDPGLYLTREGAIKSGALDAQLERLKKELDKALDAWAEATEAAATSG